MHVLFSPAGKVHPDPLWPDWETRFGWYWYMYVNSQRFFLSSKKERLSGAHRSSSIAFYFVETITDIPTQQVDPVPLRFRCSTSNIILWTFCSLSSRSSGKIQSDIPAARREELPHLLPDHVAEEARTLGLVTVAAADVYLQSNSGVIVLPLLGRRHAAGVVQPVRLPLLLPGRDHCGEPGRRSGADGHWCESFSFLHAGRDWAASSLWFDGCLLCFSFLSSTPWTSSASCPMRSTAATR